MRPDRGIHLHVAGIDIAGKGGEIHILVDVIIGVLVIGRLDIPIGLIGPAMGCQCLRSVGLGPGDEATTAAIQPPGGAGFETGVDYQLRAIGRCAANGVGGSRHEAVGRARRVGDGLDGL